MGKSHKDTTPDISATSSDCPNSFRIGEAKMYIGKSRMQHRNKTIHDLWRYIPNIWCLLAPKACPHSVSSALAMPNWLIVTKKQKKNTNM